MPANRKEGTPRKLRKTFRTTLGTEKSDLFFEIPFDVKRTFGRARPPVKVSINGYTFVSTVFVYSSRYYMPVRKEHREAAGIRLGDTIHVTLELDLEPRIVEPPPELAAALAQNKSARAVWERLSYSHKKEYADFILEAKKPETRTRRVEKTIAMLVPIRPPGAG